MKESDLSAIEKIIERYPWYSAAHLELYKRLSELGGEQRDAYLYKAAAYLYSRDRLYDIAFNTVSDEAVSEVPVKDAPVEEDLNSASGEADMEFEEEKVKTEEIDSNDHVLDENVPSAIEVLDSRETGNETEFEFIFDIDEDKEVIHKVVISGGDYFSRTDIDTIELDEEMPLDRFIVEKPSLLRSSLASREGFVTMDEVEIDSSEVFEDSGFYTETLAKIYTSQGFYKRALDVYAKLILLYPEKSAYFATLVKELKTKHNT